MYDLEKVLKNEGVLVSFLKNCDLEGVLSKNISLTIAFFWNQTEEGWKFWYDMCKTYPNYTIPRSRVKELQEVYTKLPPRYRRVI